MGVKTKVFGPPAWVQLRAFAAWCDIHKRPGLTVELLRLMPEVLPCVYCRQSMGQFLDPTSTVYVNIDMLARTFNAKTAIHAVRCAVNNKLKCQDVHPDSDARWAAYHRTVETSSYYAVESREYLDSCIRWFTYIMCDFRPEASAAIFRFLELVCMTLPPSWGDMLARSRPCWIDDWTLSDRLDVVYWMCRDDSPTVLPGFLLNLAHKGIVGCEIKK